MDELGEHGIALHADFEGGPDGKPATEAYECSGGRWTLGLGATEWPNGRAIGPNDFCTPEQAIELTNWHLREHMEHVDRVIVQPMTVNQRAAFVLLSFNIGKYAFEFNCTAAALFNERPLLPGKEDDGRRELIASAFGKWCKATNDTPDKPDLKDPYFIPVIGRNAKGDPCWVDANGQPCDYQKAMPGLLRRHLSEACLFLDLDWRQACTKKAVSIIAERVWDERDNRWEDLVRKKTELADVLPLARKHPLDLILTTKAEPAQSVAQGKAGQPEPAPQPQAPAAPAPTKPVAPSVSGSGASGPAPPPKPPQGSVVAPVPSTKPPALPTSVGTKAPSPNTKMPEHVPYRIDPNAGLKPMEETERFIGAALMLFGTFARVIMANGAALSGVTGVVVVAILDMMKSPTNLAILVSVIALGVTAVGWFIGFILDKLGLKIKKRGEATSSQGMY